jgi:hypothetical protein
MSRESNTNSWPLCLAGAAVRYLAPSRRRMVSVTAEVVNRGSPIPTGRNCGQSLRLQRCSEEGQTNLQSERDRRARISDPILPGAKQPSPVTIDEVAWRPRPSSLSSQHLQPSFSRSGTVACAISNLFLVARGDRRRGTRPFLWLCVAMRGRARGGARCRSALSAQHSPDR